MTPQKELFRKYVEKYGKFHFVYALYRPSKWKIYPDDVTKQEEETLINHREIFPDELVFDLDLKDAIELKKQSDYLKERLKKFQIQYVAWNSGGKCSKENIANHFHTIFPELMEVEPDKRKIWKDELYKFVLGTHLTTSKCDLQLSSRHLIRAEFGKHERTVNYKSLIEEYRLPIEKPNKIPETWKYSIQDTIKKMNEQKTSKVEKRSANVEIFPCVAYFLSLDFGSLQDGRSRALAILCNFFYKSLGDKGINAVKEWNDYKLNRYFSEDKINVQFNSIKRMVESGRNFGCTYTKKLLSDLGKSNICSDCLIDKKRG